MEARLNYQRTTRWLTRLVLTVIFCFNVGCAWAFLARPADYAPGFEIEGVVGRTIVRGVGILFLMWNATYPLAIWRPWRHRQALLIIIAQQVIGVAGESWLLLTLAPGHAPLRATAWGFITFDAGGLVAMLLAFVALYVAHKGRIHSGNSSGHQPGGDHARHPESPSSDQERRA